MPNRFPPGAETPKQRRARRGVTDHRIHQLLAIKETPVLPLSANQQDYLPRIIKWYAQLAAQVNGHHIHGVKYYDWETATGPDAPTWSGKAFQTFLFFVSIRVNKTHGKRITQRTFFGDCVAILSLYNRARRLAGRDQLSDDLTKVYWQSSVMFGKKLPADKIRRTHLRPEGVVAMLVALPRLDRPIRSMMSYTLYISISAGTGFCYGSICRGGDAKWDDLKDSQRGLRWRSTVLWVVEGQGELNDVVAYVSPEHVKGGAHTLQTFFPIMSTPVLAASANWMLLLTLFLDSGRTVEDLKRVLDPKFLGPEKKPRRIHVPSAVENKFLVQGRRPDQTPTMKSVNLVLKSVSRLSGFDGDVTTHCFRHLIGDEVYEKRGFEATRRTLQHKKTTSTRYYISPVLPSYVTQALFDDPDGSPLAKRLRRATSKPDSNAPIPANLALDKERLNNLKEDCELVGLLAEQQQIKGTIVESYGTITAAPEEKQRQYRSCARRYRDRLGQLCEVEFKELRDQYFDTKQRSILPPVDPNSSSTTSSSSTKRPHVATTSAEEEIDRISEDDPTFNVDLDIVNFAIEQATAEDTGLTCHDDEAVEKDVQEEDDEDDASVIAGLMGGPCCNILKLAELILA